MGISGGSTVVPSHAPSDEDPGPWLYPALAVPARVTLGLFRGALCPQAGSQGSPRLGSNRAPGARVRGCA